VKEERPFQPDPQFVVGIEGSDEMERQPIFLQNREHRIAIAAPNLHECTRRFAK
jgi:hypothetical protein